MPDMGLNLSETGVDLRVELGDLVLSETLLEPILVSLYSDARAPADADIPDGTGDPRGWWAEDLGTPFGSHLWLLERAKHVQESAVLAAGYAKAALAWLLEEDIAAAVEVTGTLETDEETGLGFLALEVVLTRGASTSWATAWEATKAEDWSADRWRLNLLLQ